MMVNGKGAIDLGGGWYRLWTSVAVNSALTRGYIYTLQDDGTRTYAASGTPESTIVAHAQQGQ